MSNGSPVFMPGGKNRFKPWCILTVTEIMLIFLGFSVFYWNPVKM
jgi:hypothetical protein